MRVIAGFLAFLLLAMAQLSAQEPRLQVSVDTSVVSVGDRIKLTVSVDHHPGARLAWPDSLALTPFEVLGAEVPPPVSQGETTRSSMVLVLAAFELGDLEIPSFEIQVTDPEGEVTTLSTSRYGIQ
ncbi:MAG: BatD family protein, partial [Gemmatimonadetes bacterium]|nr:BatD family protein [Gemmatimonadota bacterium]